MATRIPGFVKARRTEVRVRPASCFGDCFSECIADGGMSKTGCRNLCAQECGGVPRDPGPGPPQPPAPAGLPIYGNYCGPGYGDPAGNVPPVDAVDAACRVHDLCYGTRGYFDCGCDRALLAVMPGAIAATASPRGRAAGAVVMAYFAQAPCVCNIPVCVPPFGPCATVPVPGGVGGAGPC